jgi:uncharacterized membrane protein YhhN
VSLFAFVLLGAALVTAVIDWVAVVDKDTKLEHWCKPGVIVLLIALTFALDPESDVMRTWFLAALLFSLAGDVFLMLDGRHGRNLFVAGLASFLIAHVAYIGGFLVGGVSVLRLFGGLVLAAISVALVGNRILQAAKEKEPELALPVFAYMAVISAMLVVAIGSGKTAALVGALLFYASDAMIGWSRFVKPLPWLPLAIIVTYHLAQAALVVSLV